MRWVVIIVDERHHVATNPSLDVVRRLSRVLRVSLRELLG
jgi:hypothetical protein